MYGSSITHQGGLDRVRGVMGVCTQFDVLWDNLTGREHLLLFGAIKGLSRVQAGRQADALLDQVSRFWGMTCTNSTVTPAVEQRFFLGSCFEWCCC